MSAYISKEAFLDFMEAWAPKRLAEPWDNVGMLIDMGATSYRKILVALDFCQATVEEAIHQKVDLIVTHHPILMTPIRSLSVFDVEQQLMMACVQHGISHFAAHTNLDSAEKGINVCLANTLELIDHQSILPKTEIFKKVVVYVPNDYAETVRDAMCAAGAGHIGQYDSCSFSSKGVGTFRAQQGAKPFIGQEGELSSVEKIRLESIVQVSQLGAVLSAMQEVHPYEEVAYDVFDMALTNDSIGLMRMGQLPQAMKGEEFCLWVKEKLQIPFVRVGGPMKRPIRQVAVSCGSGFSDVHYAMMQGADALVGGELKHHIALNANEEGILLVDAGHFETERIICPYLIEGLQEHFDGVKYKTEFLLHDPKTGPITTI